MVGEINQSRQCSYICCSSYAKYVNRFFNCFGDGRPFHNVQFLTIHNAVRFPNSSPMVFSKTSLRSIHGCCVLLRLPTRLAVFIPFLRCSCTTTSRHLMSLLQFRFRLTSPPDRPYSLDFLCHICPGTNFSDDASLESCHSCRQRPVSSVVHNFPWSFPSASGGALLPDSAIVPFQQSSDRQQCGFSIGNLLMLDYGLHFSWSSLHALRLS
jgi:hypothetical protein